MNLEIKPGEIIHAPVCHVCKEQDETLRAITIPFVFSVVIATFQRNFSGVYCRKHRRGYLALASLITAVFGWFGFPFGFLLTPITLWNIISGGRMDSRENAQMLTQLANKKMIIGDMSGALRCKEQVLYFETTEETRQNLVRAYSSTGANLNAPTAFRQFAATLSAFLFAVVAGFTTGVLDAVANYLFSTFITSQSIITGIASWIPLILFLFIALLFIQSMLRFAIIKGGLLSKGIAVLLSGFLPIFLLYSYLNTLAILNNVFRIIQTYPLSAVDAWTAIKSLLLSGGYFLILNSINDTPMVGLVLATLTFFLAAVGVVSNIRSVLRTQKWCSVLLDLQKQVFSVDEPSSKWAGFVLFGAILSMGAIAGLLWPAGSINVHKAFVHAEKGMAAITVYKTDEAIKEFEEFSNIWPDSYLSHFYKGAGFAAVQKYNEAIKEYEIALEIDPNSHLTHYFLGLLYLQIGDFERTLSELDIAAQKYPDLGPIHGTLANIYWQLDRPNLAENELNISLEYAETDNITASQISTYYYQTGDLEKAEAYILKALNIKESAGDYFILYHIYLDMKRYDDAGKLLASPQLQQQADPVDYYSAQGLFHIFTGDMGESERVILGGLKQYPSSGLLYSDLAFVHVTMGEYEKALVEAKQAIDLSPYDSSGYVELAYANFYLGNVDDAMAAVKESLEIVPKNGRALYILGRCYADKGNEAQAIEAFEKFLQISYDRPYMQEHISWAKDYIENNK